VPRKFPVKENLESSLVTSSRKFSLILILMIFNIRCTSSIRSSQLNPSGPFFLKGHHGPKLQSTYNNAAFIFHNDVFSAYWVSV
jgi:hypothetical protein